MMNVQLTINKCIFLYFLCFYVLSISSIFPTQAAYCDQTGCEPPFSTPEECARQCQDGEPPKICQYNFTVEFYTTVNRACDTPAYQGECIVADGVEKTITTINRQLPGPLIEVCNGDLIVVDVENKVLGQEVTIHWHGIFQNGYQYYDGVPYLTQCPIPSSTTFRYQFEVKNSGTHFYHSHVATHMMDGQSGSLIVRDPPSKNPHISEYDIDDNIIFLQDWWHDLSLERFPGWYRHDIGQTAKNILINGKGNWTDPDTKETSNAPLAIIPVTEGKRHRLRIINSFSTVCLAELSIEGHNCTVIAQDGENVKPVEVNALVTSSGERVDCVLNANQPKRSYWIQVRGLGECSEKEVQQLAILRYDDAPMPPPTPLPAYSNAPSGVVYNSLDASNCNTQPKGEALCVNQLESLEDENELLKVEPDERHILNFWFYNYTLSNSRLLFKSETYPEFFSVNDGSQLLSMFNNIAYETPASPLISQRSSRRTICRSNELDTCTQPCSCTQVINTNLNSVVELIIYDQLPLTDLHHPFHLHGYSFRVFAMGVFPNVNNVTNEDVDRVLLEHRQRLEQGEYTNPPGKDTVKIPMGGYAIIRFQANNPGWWLLHCHFSWHHITGMELVLRVGHQYDLPPVPPGFPRCNNWKPPVQALNDFYGFNNYL
ncbi:uncharacterized protein LOC143178243 isoform X2 [Calliopsis andreniformis]|uniref:uncharacterized protein LOC143178243 isoform X2 n=1 Tax=Calliopsis andreniformis TaxID=337506 RepID=UPI003FCE6B3C